MRIAIIALGLLALPALADSWEFQPMRTSADTKNGTRCCTESDEIPMKKVKMYCEPGLVQLYAVKAKNNDTGEEHTFICKDVAGSW